MDQEPAQAPQKPGKTPKFIAAIILVIISLAIGVWLFMGGDDSAQSSDTPALTQSQNASSQESPQTEQPTQETQAVLTAEEVAKHASADNCWTIIDNNVYDITSYISRHPGGSEILHACGSDASSLFNNRTTDDGEAVGSGTPHSGSAQAQLRQFLLGPLEQ